MSLPLGTPIEVAQQNDPSATQPASIPLPQQHLSPVAPAVEDAAAPAPVVAPLPAPEVTPEQFKGMMPTKKTLTPKQFSSLVPKHANLESMMKVAPKAKEHIDAVAQKIAETIKTPHSVITSNIKNLERSKEKIKHDYNGDHNRITDLARNTVLVPHKEHIAEFVKAAKEHGAEYVQHLKGNEPGFMGYSGALAKFMTPHGIKAEVQANTPEMIVAKESPEIARRFLGEEHFNTIEAKFKKAGISVGQGHKLYEQARKLNPTRAEYKAIAEKSKKYYEAARKVAES